MKTRTQPRRRTPAQRLTDLETAHALTRTATALLAEQLGWGQRLGALAPAALAFLEEAAAPYLAGTPPIPEGEPHRAQALVNRLHLAAVCRTGRAAQTLLSVATPVEALAEGYLTVPEALEAVQVHVDGMGEVTALLAAAWPDLATLAASEPIHEAAAIGAPADADGSTWDVVVIKAGTSANNRLYPAETLRQAAGLFDGARVFFDHAGRDEARNRPERSVKDIAGWLDTARWDEAAQSILARLHLTDAADALRKLLMGAYRKGKRDLLGLSIAANGELDHSQGGPPVVRRIGAVESVDLVTVPAAGGALLQPVAA